MHHATGGDRCKITVSKIRQGGPAQYFCQIQKFLAGVSALNGKKKVHQFRTKDRPTPKARILNAPPPCQNWALTVPWWRLLIRHSGSGTRIALPTPFAMAGGG